MNHLNDQQLGGAIGIGLTPYPYQTKVKNGVVSAMEPGDIVLADIRKNRTLTVGSFYPQQEDSGFAVVRTLLAAGALTRQDRHYAPFCVIEEHIEPGGVGLATWSGPTKVRTIASGGGGAGASLYAMPFTVAFSSSLANLTVAIGDRMLGYFLEEVTAIPTTGGVLIAANFNGLDIAQIQDPAFP